MKDRNGNERHYMCPSCTRTRTIGWVRSNASPAGAASRRPGCLTPCVHDFAMAVAAERQAAELLGTTFPDIDATDYDEDV